MGGITAQDFLQEVQNIHEVSPSWPVGEITEVEWKKSSYYKKKGVKERQLVPR